MKDSRYVKEGEERILAIYFHTTGFGFSLMNSPIEVLEKGMVTVNPVDNKEVMRRLKKLIKKTNPERMVIEDYTGNNSCKSHRIIELLRATNRHAKQKGIPLSRYSREQIQLVFSNWKAKTRYEIATVIAQNVETYQNLLFKQPKYPRFEHFRSPQFDAASLGITHFYMIC